MFKPPTARAPLVFGVHSCGMDSRCYCAQRTFVGQVERDGDGALWATLYAAPAQRRPGFVLRREPVRSLRHGRRRVSDMVLAEADASARLASAGR